MKILLLLLLVNLVSQPSHAQDLLDYMTQENLSLDEAIERDGIQKWKQQNLNSYFKRNYRSERFQSLDAIKQFEVAQSLSWGTQKSIISEFNPENIQNQSRSVKTFVPLVILAVLDDLNKSTEGLPEALKNAQEKMRPVNKRAVRGGLISISAILSMFVGGVIEGMYGNGTVDQFFARGGLAVWVIVGTAVAGALTLAKNSFERIGSFEVLKKAMGPITNFMDRLKFLKEKTEAVRTKNQDYIKKELDHNPKMKEAFLKFELIEKNHRFLIETTQKFYKCNGHWVTYY